MSLHPTEIGPMPEETARVARAAFPHGNTYLRLRDALGGLYDDVAFAPLFTARGRPAETPWRLALVTVMQFAEGLSDRQAAGAVCSRIDWKYALGLPLDDPGFDASVLSEFRTRLVRGQAEHHHFEGNCHGKLLARGGGRAVGLAGASTLHPLQAPSLSGRAHQPRGVAVLPVPAQLPRR